MDLSLLQIYEKCLHAKYIDIGGGDYSIERDRERLWIFLQWSDEKEDWIKNFDFPHKAYKNGNDVWFCHRGFLNSWKLVRDEIEKRVEEELGKTGEGVLPIKEIICVGYSHGAALTVLCKEDMEYLFGNRVQISGYAYACPRVIWGRIPKNVSERIQDIVVINNFGDIVPHLPPLIFGFRNVGQIKIIGDKSTKRGPIKSHLEDAYKSVLRDYEEEVK